MQTSLSLSRAIAVARTVLVAATCGGTVGPTASPRFDAAAARAFGGVAAALRRTGRKAAARAYDAMIAAIALANGLPLYMCNAADFEGIEGLIVVSVPHPDASA